MSSNRYVQTAQVQKPSSVSKSTSILKYREILSPPRQGQNDILEEAQRSTRFNQILRDNSRDRNPKIEQYLSSTGFGADDFAKRRTATRLLNGCNSSDKNIPMERAKLEKERPSTAAGHTQSRLSEGRLEGRPLSTLGLGDRFIGKTKIQRESAYYENKERQKPHLAVPSQPIGLVAAAQSTTGVDWMSRKEPITYQRSIYSDKNTGGFYKRTTPNPASQLNRRTINNDNSQSKQTDDDIPSTGMDFRKSIRSGSEQVAPSIEDLNSKYEKIASVVVRLEKAMNIIQKNLTTSKNPNADQASADDNTSAMPDPHSYKGKDTLSVQHEQKNWSRQANSKKSIEVPQQNNSNGKRTTSSSSRKPKAAFTPAHAKFEEDKHSKAESSPISKTTVQNIALDEYSEQELRELRAKIDSKLFKKPPISSGGFRRQESAEEVIKRPSHVYSDIHIKDRTGPPSVDYNPKESQRESSGVSSHRPNTKPGVVKVEKVASAVKLRERAELYEDLDSKKVMAAIEPHPSRNFEKAREGLNRMKGKVAIGENTPSFSDKNFKSETKLKSNPPETYQIPTSKIKRQEETILRKQIEPKRQVVAPTKENIILEEREPNTTTMTFQESDNSVLEIKQITEKLSHESNYPFSAFLKN